MSDLFLIGGGSQQPRVGREITERSGRNEIKIALRRACNRGHGKGGNESSRMLGEGWPGKVLKLARILFN